MKRLAIIADNLLVGSPVARLLEARGVQITPSNLTAGHYLITGRCAILHVYGDEFARWTAEKTVFRRITEFKHAVGEPVVIIEGRQPTTSKVASSSALRGALAFVAVHNRVPILFSADEQETADLIYAMANQVQNGMGQSAAVATAGGETSSTTATEPVAAAEPVEEDPADAAERMVRLIPDVGPVTARALLKRFGNLRGLFTATANDLVRVNGIGPKKAKKIISFFSHRTVL